MTATVIVGGGLQGVSIALELSRRGRSCTILDQDPQPMNRASLRNEGKIHLGLIYAADPTFATASIQLDGALSFAPLLRRWIGEHWNDVALSTPFAYLVAENSLFQPDQLADHYGRLTAECRRRLAEDPELDYLGRRPDELARPMRDEEARRWFDTADLLGVFETEELAIDTDDLARVLRAAIRANDRIRFRPNRRVETVERKSNGLKISGHGPDGLFSLDAEQVVNCSWESRFRLDRMMGLKPPEGWLHRLKFRTIAALPDELRGASSATMVLGAYGDVVVRPSGTAYLSWYPTGLRGWTHDEAPPRDWDPACRGETADELADEIAASAREHIDRWFPGMARARPLAVDAGVIVAYGRTDVDDAASELHDRTRIGVNGGDDYFSVDPGKLTTAPLFAMQAVDSILGQKNGTWR